MSIELLQAVPDFSNPTMLSSRINFDDLWAVSLSPESVEEGIEMRFKEWQDNSNLREDGVSMIIYCDCIYGRSVNLDTVKLLIRQFVRFNNLIIIFDKISYEVRCKIGLFVTFLGHKDRIKMIEINGLTNRIYQDLLPGEIYLNLYAPKKPN